MDIPAPATIEQRYGTEAAAEWRLLLNQFALGDGFALVVLTVPGPDGAALCADELGAFLAPQARHLAYVASRTTEELRALAPRLLALPDDAARGAVWVIAAFPDITAEQDNWQAAWRYALGSLNQQRNPLRRKFHVPVIVVGAPWLVPLLREMAPDLWSVRSLVVRIEPAREAAVASEGWIRAELALPIDRDRLSADVAPDPALSMREAARLRGVVGQELALVRLLARAGQGFWARGALRAAEDALEEAAELAARSGAPEAAAAAWHDLAVVRHELGDREVALAAAREAAELYRALAAQRPDAFRPDLAMSLNNLANMLSDLGEHEAALAAAREAVELYRALAAQRSDAFRPDLATSLNNLALSLSDLGEREAALAAAREAVDIRRALAAQRPDAFRHDLARSLSVLAGCLEAAGQIEAALAADVEAMAALTPAFTRTPQAFAPLMAAVVQDYRRRCEAVGTEPDETLLAPVAQVFAVLREPAGDGDAAGAQSS